jgi:hypothetical protein
VESVSAGGYDGLIVGEATGIKVGAKDVTTAVGGAVGPTVGSAVHAMG